MKALMRGIGPGLFAILLTASPALADDSTLPDYRDDRSTPEAVVESLYNAIARREYLRGWSYFSEDAVRPFADFARGYGETEAVRVKTGMAQAEGAAGSIFYLLPVVVEATGQAGKKQVFAGCYELRLVQPSVQATPPFMPMSIVKSRLAEVGQPFDTAMGDCPEEGL